jgi:amino acid transporter
MPKGMSKGRNPPPKIFAREATGLVREVGALPSFIAQFMLVTGGYPIYLLTYLYYYPGANFALAFLLGFLPMLALLGVYALFGISMPRTGGDYIYVSRGLNSIAGFINSFAMASAYMVSAGIYLAFATLYFIYQFTSLGIIYKNVEIIKMGATLSQPIPSLIVGIILLAISFVIAILRPRIAWRFVTWPGVVSLGATAIMFVALALINTSQFSRAYDSFVTSYNSTLVASGFYNVTTYQQTISVGGWSPPKSVLATTLAAFPLALYSFTWSMLPNNWAGEIKQVKRSLPLVLIGGMAWLLVYYVLLLQLSIHAFGQPFLTAWSALSFNSSYPLPYSLSDYIPFFAYIATHSQLVFWAMFLALEIPAVFSTPPLIIACTRYLFAWSFDRLLPEKLSLVNEKTHTPVIASTIVTLINLIGLVFELFDPSAVPSVNVPIFIFGYMLVPFTALLFPFIKRQFYETIFIVKRKIFGIPVLSWLGLVAFVALVIGTYSIFASGLYTFSLPDYLFYGLVYGLGALIFGISYMVRRRQGQDILLAFREVPPE